MGGDIPCEREVRNVREIPADRRLRPVDSAACRAGPDGRRPDLAWRPHPDHERRGRAGRGGGGEGRPHPRRRRCGRHSRPARRGHDPDRSRRPDTAPGLRRQPRARGDGRPAGPVRQPSRPSRRRRHRHCRHAGGAARLDGSERAGGVRRQPHPRLRLRSRADGRKAPPDPRRSGRGLDRDPGLCRAPVRPLRRGQLGGAGPRRHHRGDPGSAGRDHPQRAGRDAGRRSGGNRPL